MYSILIENPEVSTSDQYFFAITIEFYWNECKIILSRNHRMFLATVRCIRYQIYEKYKKKNTTNNFFFTHKMFVIKHDMKYCYMSVAPVRLISDSQAIPSVPYQHRCAVFNTHGHGHTCHLRRARTSISSSIAQLCMFLYYQVWERERETLILPAKMLSARKEPRLQSQKLNTSNIVTIGQCW